MTISALDCGRLREEEAVREALRREHRRQRQPRLLAMAVVWTLILTALAFVSAHFHG
jgi:predicted nucleic acid-binding Zn ribbon protein